MKLPVLTSCPALISECANDSKVRRVSGVHHNIFRHAAVVNHLHVPLGAVRVQVSSWIAADGPSSGGKL